jgi:ABC-type glycerol-3-phosphate transport system permease component
MVTGGIERTVRTTTTYGVLCALAAFCIFPFLWMIDTALKPPDEVRNANPTFWIAKPTLENFRHVVNDGNFLVYFRNSMIVAGGSTLLALMVSIFCGYALSRFHREPLSRTVGTALLLSQMIPGVLLLTPLYILMRPTWPSLDIRGADHRLLHVCNSSLLLHAEKLFRFRSDRNRRRRGDGRLFKALVHLSDPVAPVGARHSRDRTLLLCHGMERVLVWLCAHQ